jgi:hypothetical protein
MIFRNPNRAICDLGRANRHAGLLEGRKSLYPKLKQYLWAICEGGIVESEKFTPAQVMQQKGSYGSHHATSPNVIPQLRGMDFGRGKREAIWTVGFLAISSRRFLKIDSRD